MIVESISGAVQLLQGILTKTDSQGHTNLLKLGASLNQGDSLVLLSGATQIKLLNGLVVALTPNQPFSLDSISPFIKQSPSPTVDEMVEKALAKGLDISKFIETLQATEAGVEVLGSGGTAFIVDPYYGFGLVTAGYQTRGPFSIGSDAIEYTVFLYGNTKPEAVLTLNDNSLVSDESITVRNGDRNAADHVGVVDPFNYGPVIGFAEGYLVSSAGSSMNQPAHFVKASYSLEIGKSASGLYASNGSPITLSLVDNKIVAKSEGKVIFAIGIDEQTGKITVVQYHGIYHPDSTSADESISLTNLIKVALTLTDKSGDVSKATIDIGGKIHFEDDAPFINAIDSLQVIDDPNNHPQLFGTIDVDFGSDLAKDLVFTDTAITVLQNAGLSSLGYQLIYSLDNESHTLTARSPASGEIVFTLQLSEVTPNAPQAHMPQYILTVYEAIDQPDNAINLLIPVKAIDADNDSVKGHIQIIIKDGADAAGGINTEFIATEGDLDATSGGYPVTTHHSFDIAAGVDRLIPGSLIIEPHTLNAVISEIANEVTAGGYPLTLTSSNVNGVIVLTVTDSQNEVIFKMTITPTNIGKDLHIEVTLEQFKPLDHQAFGDTNGLVRQDGDSLHIDLTFQAKDSDGDPLQNPVIMNVTINDGEPPALGNHQLIFTESLNTQTQSGQVPLNLGSDTVATLVFENTPEMQQSLDSLTSGGKQTSYFFEDNDRVLVLKIDDASSPLNGQVILRVTINTDGSYIAVLSGPLDQVNDESVLILNVLATDKDADISTLGEIKIIINDADNIPHDTHASVSITEGDLSEGTYPVVSPSVDFILQSSADRLLPETVTFNSTTIITLLDELSDEIKVDGQSLDFAVSDDGRTITGSLNGDDILIIQLSAEQSADGYNVDAHIEVILNGPIDHNQNNGSGMVRLSGDQIIIQTEVQIKDSDGDYLANPALINVEVNDGNNPELTPQNPITLIEPASSTETTAQTTFAIDVGSDPIKSLGFNYTNGENSGIKSAGHDVLFEVVNGELKGYYLDGGIRVDVLSATITYTDELGTVNFVLFKPVDHPSPGEDTLPLNLKIQAVDTDGDAAFLEVPVFITDSIADPKETAATVVEGESINGDLSEFYNLNSEGGHLHTITVNGDTYSFDVNSTHTIDTGKGDFIINSDGTWEFHSVDGLDHDDPQELTIIYTIIDGDGDISDSHLVIAITDGAPSDGGQNLDISLSEGDLAPEITYPILTSNLVIIDNNGSDPFDLETFAIQNQTVLADEIASELKFFNTTTGEEENVVVIVSNQSITITSASGIQVLTITLSPVLQPDGEILLTQTVTLYQPLSHLNVNNTDNVRIIDDQVIIQYTALVSDIDGTELASPVKLTATINDGDNPELIDTTAAAVTDGSSETTGVMELNIGSDPVATITFDSSQPDLTGLTSNGHPTTSEIGDHSIKIFDNNHTLIAEFTLTNTGDYIIQLYGPLDQGDSDLLSIPLSVTATDRDGDSDTALLIVQIRDGANPQGGNVVDLAVTEGSLSGTPGYPVSTTQNFTLAAGSDRLLPQTLDIDSTIIASILTELGNEVKSGGQTVTYTYDDTTHTLTGKVGTDIVLTLTFNATQDGQDVNVSSTFTLYKPVDHIITGNNTGYVTVNGSNITIKTPLQITDSDGDKLDLPVNVTTTITDGVLPVINPINPIIVEESDISNTNTHRGSTHSQDGETATGQITVQEGSDKVVNYRIDVEAFNDHTDGSWTANGLPISLVISATTATMTTYSGVADGITKFILVLNNITGEYTYTLLGAIDHELVQGKNTLEMLFTVVVTDADGDPSAVGTLPVIIQDDIPSAVDVILSSITEGEQTGTVDLIPEAYEGADTGKIVSVVDGDTTYTLSGTGYNQFTIYDDAHTQELGTLFIRADGRTYFVSNANINHDSLVLTKQLTFNVRDFDGDTAAAQIIINITDEQTALTIATASGVEDQGRDPNEVIIDPVTSDTGIPIHMQINIGDYDNGETVSKVLIQIPGTAHGSFYYDGAVLTTTTEGGINYYVVPLSAFTTTDNINYILNGVTFIPDADYSTTTTGINYTVKVGVDTDSGSKEDVTRTLNINVKAIADTPTWDADQTIIQYNGAEDEANIALQIQGQLQDIDESESLDYYLLKITEGNGILVGEGLEPVNVGGSDYWKVSADNIGTVQVDPAQDFSGIIRVEAIVVSKEAENFVPGQQYAQSAPIVLTIDVAPVADSIKLTIVKPYFVSNEDELINLNNLMNLSKAADNIDLSENTFIRVSGIPDGATFILHGVELDVSGLAPGMHNLSITYTDGTGEHTVNYQYYKDASNSSNSYYQVNTVDLNQFFLKPIPESNVDFVLKVQGVVIDTAQLSTGQQTSELITETQLVSVNMKGVADIPIFEPQGTDWSLTPNGIETTIVEDGTAQFNFNLLSGEKALAPTDTSETLTMVISGIPDGAQLFDSNGNPLTLTYVGRDDLGQPKYEVNLASLDDLVIRPPVNSTKDINLTARIIVTENDGNSLIVEKQIVIHITPVIDAGDYSKTSIGLEDNLFTVNWMPPQFSDSQEVITGIKLENIPEGSKIFIDNVEITTVVNGTVILSTEQVNDLLNGKLLQFQGPEDSDVDVNLNAIVTVSQSDVDDPNTIITTEIKGSLHLDIRAVVENDAELQVINNTDQTEITTPIHAWNGSTVDLSTGADSQGRIVFQDLDSSSDETIKMLVIDFPDNSGAQFIVVGGIYNGSGGWVIPESQLDNLQIISRFGYNGSLAITIHAQVQDMGDNGENDVSALDVRHIDLTLEFTGSGTGPGIPTEAGTITIHQGNISGQEDVPVETFGDQLESMLSLANGTPDDVYALIIEGPLPDGFTLSGTGVIYDFANDRYVITATPDGMGGLNVGEVILQTPEDYSGSLPFNVDWVATNMASGDVNQGTAPVEIPVNITPIADAPNITLQVVQTEGLDANMQPGGDETIPNLAYEDGLITLNLGVLSTDNDLSEQITSVQLKVDPDIGHFVDSNGNPLDIDNDGFITVSVNDLNNIKFQPVEDYSGPVPITAKVEITDTAITGTDVETFTQNLNFNVLPVNDTVIFGGPDSFNGNEDVNGGVAFTGMTVSTNDSDGSEQIVSLVIHNVPEGFLIGSAQNMGNGDWKITVNSSSFDLSNIKLIPPDDFSGSVVLDVTAYTKEALTTLPEAAGTHQITLTVAPVSDVVDTVGDGPDSSVVGIENTDININLNIQARDNTNTYTGTGTNVTENSPETLLLTIRGVPDGAELSLPAGVNGSFTKEFNTATNDWTWTFTVNSFQLANIIYSPGDSNGLQQLRIEAQAVDGNADAGPVKVIIVDLDVTPVNDAPENIVPSEINAVEDQSITLMDIRISDIDAREDNGDMTVTLRVGQGILTLGNVPGVTIDNNGTALVMISGTIDAINALLAAGVTYQGNQDYNGIDILIMTTNDNGNSGGDSLITESSVPIIIEAVNDAPMNTVPAEINVNEDQSITLTSIQISDIDAREDNGTMTVTLEVGQGILTLGALSGVTVDNNGTALVTISGTIDAINALLAAGVTYQGNQDYNGDDILKMTTDDNGNSGGGSLITESSVPIHIAAVNDAPVNTVPDTPLDAYEDEPMIISGLQVTDVDAESGNITVTLAVTQGTLTLIGDTTDITVTGINSNTLKLEGTLADINVLLESGVIYQGNGDFHGIDSLTMTTNDNGNTGNGGPWEVTDGVAITVNPRADTPDLTVVYQTMIAALGALIPLHISAEVMNPIDNELTVKLDGLGNAIPVNDAGVQVGTFLGNGLWEIPHDQLSNLYLQNVAEGTHDITVTAVSDVNDGQPEASVPQTINLTVIDSAQNELQGTGGNDYIVGSDFNDVLIGVFGDDILDGKGGDDLLIGGDGNDVLIGGAGDDILTGGNGEDVFKWEVNDHGAPGQPDMDVITDFNQQEDKIDLSELLQGENTSNYSNYLHFEYDSATETTVLSISTEGNFDENAPDPNAIIAANTDQVIFIHGVDFVNGSNTQTEIITNLVALQQVILDA